MDDNPRSDIVFSIAAALIVWVALIMVFRCFLVTRNDAAPRYWERRQKVVVVYVRGDPPSEPSQAAMGAGEAFTDG